MLLKCKMCGGDLEIEAGMTTAECPFCGTRQTLPNTDDDQRLRMYDRANHFRRNNEYDKAMGLYEKILESDPSDAEAFWSIVLCRYGIEYVEDPASGKRVPTINRAQYTSILADADYKEAMDHADAVQKSIYEEEARYIDSVQKGILAVSRKEKPFDVFLCYKETDDAGRRTRDSVTANEIYHELEQEGLKTFYARITLEDKIGEAYEPYIFAALNSARVMVVLGSRPEYFNAVWVKNEWSRYLSLIRQGQKKTLIPAYKDMDPYDLPEEFSNLQALDMNKLGFMPDLIRGIKKMTEKENDAKHQEIPVQQQISAQGGSTAPLLKRAFMFLEDGDWRSAEEYCEKVLDADPENGRAYLGKLMAGLQVRKESELKNLKQAFENNGNYSKILRYGDETTVQLVKEAVRTITDRNEHQRQAGIFTEASDAFRKANSVEDCSEVKKILQSIPNFEGSRELQQK